MKDAAELWIAQAIEVVNDPGRLHDPEYTGTDDGRFSPKQLERTRLYVRDGESRVQACLNKDNTKMGRRSHEAITGTANDALPIAEFEQPWHLWCRACHEEASRVEIRPGVPRRREG